MPMVSKIALNILNYKMKKKNLIKAGEKSKSIYSN